MPVYEYECSGCEKVFEVQQRLSEKPLSTCPTCGGEVRKLISMSSFQLKGGGWYSDGYSSSGACGTKTDGGACSSDAGSSTCAAGGGCCQCPGAAH